MEFLKKTWKFFLGVVVTILGTLLIFRKDDSGELIDKSTRAGNNALDKVIKSNATRKEKTAAAAENSTGGCDGAWYLPEPCSSASAY